jgi:hypothetical protein
MAFAFSNIMLFGDSLVRRGMQAFGSKHFLWLQLFVCEIWEYDIEEEGENAHIKPLPMDRHPPEIHKVHRKPNYPISYKGGDESL